MKEYSVWLSLVKHLSERKKAMLIEAFGGADGVYTASRAELAMAVPSLSQRDLSCLEMRDLTAAEDICRRVDILDGDIIDYVDNRYPLWLKEISHPPTLLYVRGSLPDMDKNVAVGIVGQRKATVAGMKNAATIAYELSRNGIIVVSGMAAGIDGAAHKGALDGGSPTVAVLGTPIDRCYPVEHASLMRRIIENGAVISEYPPGAVTYPSNFLARNRIISGISRGVLVVEARRRSGSLVTAQRACEQNRDIFVVPGPIDSEDYIGSNGLIKDGAALVTEAADILTAYGFSPEAGQEAGKNKPKKQENVAEKQENITVPAQKKAFDDPILGAIGKIAHVDAIMERVDMDPGEVMARLTMLELQGLIVQRPGNYFEIKR